MSRPTTTFAYFRGTPLHITILLLALLLVDAKAATLDDAITERDKGRSFTALAILEQLHQESPDSNRIKLEIALLKFQLEQYDEAVLLLNEVLAEPELPPKVRVNTQLLLVKAQRMQRHQEEAGVSVSFSTTAGISRYSAFSQTLVDGSASLHLTNSQKPINLAGYAVTPAWVNQGMLQLVNKIGAEHTRAELDLSTGLGLSLMNYHLQPGLNYEVTDEGSELAATLNGSWQARPRVRIGSHLEKSLAAKDGFTFLHYVQLWLHNDRPFHLSLKYYGQSRTEGIERQEKSPRFGSSFAYRKDQEWTLGGDWALDRQEDTTTQEIYLRGAHPLSHGFTLTTELRHLSYMNNSNGWYGRLGILWKI